MKADSHYILISAIAMALPAHAALWTPSQISTSAWYDASVQGSITTDGAYANGVDVTDWADLSGNGVHLTQATAGDRPSVVTGGINGLDVLQFDNRTEDLDAIVGGNPVLIDATWVAVVLQYNRGSAAFSTALGSQNASGGDNYTIQYRGDVNADRWQGGYRTNGNPESSNGASVITNPTVVVHDDINLIDFRLNVGSDRGLNNRAWDGYIAEVIYGTQDIDGDDTDLRDTIEGYLAHKWGTAGALPNDHPYKNAAPTVIPEPSSLALFGIGAFSLLLRRRR